MEAKAFELAEVLMVITNKVLPSREGFAGLKGLLSWMVGESLQSHQMSSVLPICRVYLRKQHPNLLNVTVPKQFTSIEHGYAWLAEQEAKFGRVWAVQPIPQDDYTYRDAIAQAEELAGDGLTVAVLPDTSR